MEASEAIESTESTETTEAPAEAAYAEPEVAPGPAEETGPPDVGEALQQMQATIDARLPAPEEEEEPDLFDTLAADYYGEEGEEGEYEEQPEQTEQEVAEARAYLEQFVDERLAPLREEWQTAETVRDYETLIEAYPEVNDPPMAEAIRTRLEEAGLMPARGLPDARYAEMAYKSLKADAAAYAEGNPAEAGGEQQGAVLETGVGPAPQTEELDPQTKAYMDAIAGTKTHNAFTA